MGVCQTWRRKSKWNDQHSLKDVDNDKIEHKKDVERGQEQEKARAGQGQVLEDIFSKENTQDEWLDRDDDCD